jgi:hypothetical protein
MWRLSSEVGHPNSKPAVGINSAMHHHLIHTFMTNLFCKGGRPPVANKCSHHVKVSFDDLEWDALTRMMEKADETVRATFIKRLVFGKPFKVLTTDRSLAVYCAKLSEFFAQYRTVGVNYDLVVKELRANFTEKKAMTLLYKLEKTTIEMAKITADVRALSLQFDEQWSLKSR